MRRWLGSSARVASTGNRVFTAGCEGTRCPSRLVLPRDRGVSSVAVLSRCADHETRKDSHRKCARPGRERGNLFAQECEVAYGVSIKPLVDVGVLTD